MYTTVKTLAIAIAAQIIAIVAGDQNSVLVVTGRSVGYMSMGVSVGSSMGVSTGVSVGVGDAAWVTVNVFVATPPVENVTVKVYVPGDTCGTRNSMLAVLYVRAFIVPIFVVPKVMLSTHGVLKSDITIKTIVPGEPSEGFNVIDGFCAFANGIIANGRANMHRKNIISVALPNLLLILTENFIEIAPLPNGLA